MVNTQHRAAFDIPADQAYFNAPQIGPMPNCAIQAGQAAYQSKAQPWLLETFDNFFEQPGELRAKGGALLGTSPDNIALIPAASYGLAVAARNLTLQRDDEIIILDGQFPSNVYTWRALAERTGAVVKTVCRPDNQSWSECLLDAIGTRTKLIACGALHWIDGGRIDLVEVASKARRQGAAIVLDLTQSLGMMDFDLGEIDPDFVVAAAYKWLLGPYATGFLYVAPRHQNGVPLEENWINRAGSEDFTRLIDYQDTYQPGAMRFDMGERSNHQLVPATNSAIGFLLDIGLDRVQAHISDANDEIVRRLGQLGFRDETPDRAPHYLSLSLPASAPDDLARHLRNANVHVSQRGPRLRIGPHIYTTSDDIDRLESAVRAIIA